MHNALVWLRNHNPIYADIHIDGSQLECLPEDDVPEELLTIVWQERDDEVAKREQESYLAGEIVNKEMKGRCKAEAIEVLDDGMYHK